MARTTSHKARTKAPATKGERVRLNLAVTPQVKKRLEDLRSLSESETVTEVIRRALAVYEELILVKHEGGRVIIRSKDGEDEVLKLVW